MVEFVHPGGLLLPTGIREHEPRQDLLTPGPSVEPPLGPALPGEIAGRILDLESERQQANEDVGLPEDLLPGVGDTSLSLRDGFRRAGAMTVIVLATLSALDQFSTGGLAVLAPDIRDSLHVSDGVIVFIAASAGGFICLGAVPMGWLADHYRRAPIIAWAGLVLSAMLAFVGLSVNALMLFLAQFGAGVSKSSSISVHGSLLADQYPIGLRGRLSAITNFANQSANAFSPLVMAGIAALVGGASGWRWSFLVMVVPVAVASCIAFRLPEPVRGRQEKGSVLGEVFADDHPAPISIEAAFERLKRIRTLKTVVLGFAALGFGLFTGPVLSNLFLQQHYHLGTFDRGVAATIQNAAALALLPFVGRRYDRLYRQNPARGLRLLGLVILPAAALVPAEYFMPNWQLFAVLGIPHVTLLVAAYAMTGPVVMSIVPYRLRGIGVAFAAIYVFFIGATGGALASAFLTNEFGVRTAVIVLLVPSTVLGGLFIIRGASSIRTDLALATAELKEEFDEHQRRLDDALGTPVLQVRNVDFSYGNVQVLFGVDLEVRKGEVLALLGTNGAGKSSILRVVAGLGTPSRGVVRLNGQTITYVSPQDRVAMGMHLLPGGKAVFHSMTVSENLEMGAYPYRHDPAERRRRIERVLDLFPVLTAKGADRAATLSGGQQQMLGLARVLLHDPEVLLIDELSLGLAPILVQELLGVIEALRAQGLTIVIVEQSVSVALSIADRAVFLEKGRVRFEGPAQELAQRDDLVRAVFLGTEGG